MPHVLREFGLEDRCAEINAAAVRAAREACDEFATPDRPLEEVERAILDEVERLRREPVSEAELRRAKKQVAAGFLYAKDSIQNLSQQLGYYETVASWRYVEEYPDRVKAVTAEDVRRVAEKYLVEETRTVGWYDPPAEEVAS